MNELAAYVETSKVKGGFARNFLHIRISPRKTSKLIARIFERSEERREPGPGPQTPP
jgi:ribosomal protein L9